MVTEVINIKTEGHGSFDVFIGRPSRWGNPFKIGRDGNRIEVVDKYEKYIYERPDLLALLPTLRGKRLGCYCAPELCHGHVLARLADGIGGVLDAND